MNARASRLTRREEFDQVIGAGKRRRLRHLDMVWMASPTGHPRLGLIVPKFQSTAVARNRLRRRLWEAWRRQVAPRLPPLDVVLKARREAYGASFAELAADLIGWAGGVESERPRS